MRTFAQKQSQPQKAVASSNAQSNAATSGLTRDVNPTMHSRLSEGTASPRVGHDFSRIPVHAKRREPETDFDAESATGKGVQAGPDNGRHTHVDSATGFAAPAGSSGRALEPDFRLWFERRTGQNLGEVRIHRGAQAEKATRGHGALAATLGSDIALSSTVGGTDTPQGRFVLTHELIHVAQQQGAQYPMSKGPDSAAEYQAHALTPSLLVPGPRPSILRVAQPSLMFLTDLSGQHAGSAAGGITADLTSPIVVGRTVHFQVDISPTASVGPAAASVVYQWRVFDRDSGAKVAEHTTWGSQSNTAQTGIIYPRVGRFRVECTQMNQGQNAGPALTLEQDAVAEDPALAGSLSSDSDYSEAERELVDDFRQYVNDAAAGTGAQGITPRFLASVLREEMANTNTSPLPSWARGTNKAAREDEVSDVKTAIQNRAAGSSVPTKEIDRSIGVGQVKLSTAAMAQGLIPWVEQDPLNKQAGRKQVETNFAALPASTLADLHTLLAWPKSNIQTAATQLAKLKNRSNRYPSLARADFGTNQRACEIIATEYNIGPTTSIEPLANASDYGRRIWTYMSLPVMQNFFSNS